MILDELYKLAEHGVPRTHIECLIWFRENEGKIVDNDTLKGKRVPGRTGTGVPFQARKPIPANSIVSEPHYLHSGIRGSYKPAGEKIVGYDNEKRQAIWQGEDNFVQAIQTGEDGALKGYGKEIEFDGNGNWTKINYNHLPDRNYYEITGGHLQRCYDNKVPVGVIYKQAGGQKKIIGLGLITKVSTNKLDYTIEPYKMSHQTTFQFVKEDFDTVGSTRRNDALYRSRRFGELKRELNRKLSSNFVGYTSRVGAPGYRGKTKTSPYRPYTWMGFWKGKNKFNEFQFQISLTDWSGEATNWRSSKGAELSSGLWFEGMERSKKLRKKMIEQLKKQKNEFFQILKKLPSEYALQMINEDKKISQRWKISKLAEKDIEFLLQQLDLPHSEGRTKFKVARFYTKKEALDFKTGIVSELADTFEKFVPLKKFLNEESFSATPVGTQNLDDIADLILQNGEPEPFGLAIEKSVVVRILRHLEAGKNVILVGAPGVGKTELAKRILSIFGRIKTQKKGVKSVATDEWTRWHVIGGPDEKRKFKPGYVTDAAETGQWLLIDEFNRADINRAFGEMFLAIEDKEIPLLPAERKGRYKDGISIPNEFRIIGTMNDFDKNLLLTELSYGLITRFAFVDIEPDTDKEKESVKVQIVGRNKIEDADYEACKGEITKFFTFINKVREVRMIGVRTCIDIIRYMVSASKTHPDERKNYLDEAMCDYLLPQFDRLDRRTLEKTKNATKGLDAKNFTDGLQNLIDELDRIMAAFDNVEKKEE